MSEKKCDFCNLEGEHPVCKEIKGYEQYGFRENIYAYCTNLILKRLAAIEEKVGEQGKILEHSKAFENYIRYKRTAQPPCP